MMTLASSVSEAASSISFNMFIILATGC